MSARLPLSWLPRWLSRVTVGMAIALIVLVSVAPFLDNAQAETNAGRLVAETNGPGRLVALFARDATLRRTAVASALGLLVTAVVFFRPLRPSPPIEPQREKPGPPPPAGLAGA